MSVLGNPEYYIAELETRLADLERQRAVWQEHFDHMAMQIADLERQLPEGMKHCTIQFLECEKGHGRLKADNWIDNGCHWCQIAEARNAALEEAAKVADEWGNLSQADAIRALAKAKAVQNG